MRHESHEHMEWSPEWRRRRSQSPTLPRYARGTGQQLGQVSIVPAEFAAVQV